MRYEILGNSLPVVVCQPESGRSCDYGIRKYELDESQYADGDK